MARPPALLAACCALTFLILSSLVWAQSPDILPERPEAAWATLLERSEAELARPRITAEQLTQIKKRLEEIARQARGVKVKAEAELQPLRAQLKTLGPPPAEGAPAEAPEIAAERQRIQQAIDALQARIAQADLALTRVAELRTAAETRGFEELVGELMQRYPFPLAPTTVAKAVPEFLDLMRSLLRSPIVWWSALEATEETQARLYEEAAFIILALILGWSLRWALLRWFGPRPEVAAPSYARRLTGAVAEGLANGIVPALLLAGIYFRARGPDAVFSGLFREVVTNLSLALIIFLLAVALSRAVLAPSDSAWRLLPLSSKSAGKISSRVTALAGLFAFNFFLPLSTKSLWVSAELISLYSLVMNGLMAVAVLSLTPGRHWRPLDTAPIAEEADEEPPPTPSRFWPLLRRIAALIAVLAILAALPGLSNLSSYLILRLVFSLGTIASLLLLRGLLRDLTGIALRSAVLRHQLAVSHAARSRLKFWIRALLDLVVALIGVVLLLAVWGVPPQDLWIVAREALAGITIGSVTISPLDIALAVIVFGSALALTRLAQRALSERLLPRTSLDVGVRHSLSAGFGYVGIALAAFLAIATLGIDLSNIAIIAGALSVGIGFGLQNVVNNFVSGLILLIERPIKVGDWIVVSGHEGFVQRINVRATEIETFQHASIIVPNSELLSSAVVNWTHKNRLGRVEVQVGVEYGTDVDRVMEILEGCLEAEPRILGYPQPMVLFQGFGESSLDFEVRGHIAEVVERLIIQSDLRIAINRALEAAGITIPFPQRDVHLTGLEALVEAVAKKTA